MAVLLVVVLTAVVVVVICIITHRHKTRKSLDMQRLSSIHYQSTQSDITFKDNKFHTGKNGEVPICDANGAVDKNHNIEIRDAPCSYTALGPTEFNDSVFQGAAEEPVAEGAISRPTSQASIRSNEVSSKPTLEMVTRVHPSMLDHPYDSCNWENTTVEREGGGHTHRHHLYISMQRDCTIFLQTTYSLTKRLQQTTVTKCSRMTKVPHLLKETQPTSHLPKPHPVS